MLFPELRLKHDKDVLVLPRISQLVVIVSLIGGLRDGSLITGRGTTKWENRGSKFVCASCSRQG